MQKKQKILPHGKTFGGRLRELRKKKGLSQAELARKIGYKTGASISNIEMNKKPVDNRLLVKIASVLDADLHRLLTGQMAPSEAELRARMQPHITIYLSELSQQIEENRAQFMDYVSNPKVVDAKYEARRKTIHRELTRLLQYYRNVRDAFGFESDPFATDDGHTVK